VKRRLRNWSRVVCCFIVVIVSWLYDVTYVRLHSYPIICLPIGSSIGLINVETEPLPFRSLFVFASFDLFYVHWLDATCVCHIRIFAEIAVSNFLPTRSVNQVKEDGGIVIVSAPIEGRQ